MSEPEIAGKEPVEIDLEAGTHYWCTCGKSAKQPLCDGTHQGTDFAPAEFKLDEPKKVWLCMCKHTKTPPYCDGSHSAL